MGGSFFSFSFFFVVNLSQVSLVKIKKGDNLLFSFFPPLEIDRHESRVDLFFTEVIADW